MHRDNVYWNCITKAEGKSKKTVGRRGCVTKEKSPVNQNVSDVHYMEILLKEMKKFSIYYVLSFLLLILLLCTGVGARITGVLIGKLPFDFSFILNILLVLFLLYASIGLPSISIIKYYKNKKINKK